jgi:hypothetical protein
MRKPHAFPPGRRLVVVGSTSFWGHDSLELCHQVAVRLAGLADDRDHGRDDRRSERPSGGHSPVSGGAWDFRNTSITCCPAGSAHAMRG